MNSGQFWRPAPNGVSVAVKVHPRSRRPGIGGIEACTEGARLRIAVAEAAEHGRANRAACGALARALGVPASAVEVAAGAASRQKRLLVTGEPGALAARLSAL